MDDRELVSIFCLVNFANQLGQLDLISYFGTYLEDNGCTNVQISYSSRNCDYSISCYFSNEYYINGISKTNSQLLVDKKDCLKWFYSGQSVLSV